VFHDGGRRRDTTVVKAGGKPGVLGPFGVGALAVDFSVWTDGDAARGNGLSDGGVGRAAVAGVSSNAQYRHEPLSLLSGLDSNYFFIREQWTPIFGS
jgi:hypothetical protein